MNPVYFLYNYLLSVFFLFFFPVFWLYSRLSGRYYDGIGQRLGLYPETQDRQPGGSPRIWLHAASVGEVSAAAAIIDALVSLVPECSIVLSTTTEHGLAYAKEKLKTGATCIYLPVDFIVSVKKALAFFKPDVLVCLETEIWPNLFVQAKKMGIKTVIVNGRISVRSIKKYLLIRPLIRETLKCIDLFSMIRKEDADRIRKIGASRDRIHVNGNAKFDFLGHKGDPHIKRTVRKLYGITGNEPVFVAGSVRSPEEKIILKAYFDVRESFPETLLIIAPRHLERSAIIRDAALNIGLSCQFRTDLDKKGSLRTAPVVVLDTMGELQAAYSAASIAFCGGSLAPLGGQNVLEAAAWGRPVLYGPSMEDFLDAKELLSDNGGGIEVKDGQELAEKVKFYLRTPELAEAAGKAAKKAVVENSGAAQRHASLIKKILEEL